MAKDIYVEMLKEWGGFKVGEIVRFGYSKGMSRIEQGLGRKVKKTTAVNDIKEEPKIKTPPIVETTTAKLAVETADKTPKIETKSEPEKENKNEVKKETD
jgi:hypothetical protein